MLNITRMVDLSQELYHLCPVLPDFEPPKMDYICVGPRDGWKLEQVTMNLHTGTHMDAPAHLGEYSKTLDQFPVDAFQGRMVFIPLQDRGKGYPIGRSDLEPYAAQLNSDAIVLLYTGWGEKRGWTREWIYESPYLSNEGARYLAECGVKAVGIDHFSIGGTGKENEETHRIVLGADMWVAEGLQLDDPALREGDWHVMAMPLKIRDSSGAPARIVAIQWEARS
ncbi:cyclase family protein [Paenibacillus melissococcoides]|uniref:Cyclase family protein n=1 Tax=Paenibacillus melissococcoides TaxID=2912268 RepID=A0ABM9G1D9_9BACL|nr:MULTISPECIES: cyclase family protein [Paenibacillus]MEB9893721.1 cyclase family protein [Bacillus cereus]CAH8245422.1 cyclase family protein [Paenibacillus melissococcoides]CAH8710898.1 cyclase family protein [Paenibacillus melissococcoides]CAH8711699.1 cyclase family protein [Paenibacillus melissococcoides]GIO77679.1 cyclase [Paenibacillus dendritiformis]